jgi:PAS domain S-box-containing protein
MASLYYGEEEMLAALETLALVDDPMFVIDDRHRIVFWNRAIRELLGYTHDEVAGRSCASVLAGSDVFGNRYCSDECPVQLIARRGESVRQFRLRLRAKEAGLVMVDVTVTKFTMRASRRVLLAHHVRAIEESAAAVTASVPSEPVRASSRMHADARVRELTSREVEILTMLAAGQNVNAIAAALGISRLTARNHVQHVFEKLEVHSKSEAVAFAYRMQIVASRQGGP